MIFLFYSNFSLNDSLENTVYEYLKWLKFQAFSEVSFPELLQGVRLQHPQTPQLYYTLSTAVQNKRVPWMKILVPNVSDASLFSKISPVRPCMKNELNLKTKRDTLPDLRQSDSACHMSDS